MWGQSSNKYGRFEQDLTRRVRHERARWWRNRQDLEIQVNFETGQRTVRVKEEKK
jgi:beta-lactamase superfamily II metal-dependent hydrolase